MEIRYVDYGGYDRVKIDSLRQIRWVFFPPAALCCPDNPAWAAVSVFQVGFRDITISRCWGAARQHCSTSRYNGNFLLRNKHFKLVSWLKLIFWPFCLFPRRGSFLSRGHVSVGGDDERRGVAGAGKPALLTKSMLPPFWLHLTRLCFSAKVSNYDNNTGLPLVHLWNVVGDEVLLRCGGGAKERSLLVGCNLWAYELVTCWVCCLNHTRVVLPGGFGEPYTGGKRPGCLGGWILNSSHAPTFSLLALHRSSLDWDPSTGRSTGLQFFGGVFSFFFQVFFFVVSPCDQIIWKK